MGFKLHTIVAYLWWFQWVIFSRRYMGQLSWDGIKKWGIKFTLYLGKLEYCMVYGMNQSIASYGFQTYATRFSHKFSIISIQYVIIITIKRVYIVYMSCIFALFSCFYRVSQQIPSTTHTQLPFTKSLSLSIPLSPLRTELKCWPIFFLAWPQWVQVVVVQSKCNQCWITFPKKERKKKTTRPGF